MSDGPLLPDSVAELRGVGLPPLTKRFVRALFEAVYTGAAPGWVVRDPIYAALWTALFQLKEYYWAQRIDVRYAAYRLYDPVLGPFETNSEGTDHWLALCLVLADLYGVGPQDLGRLLK
jgi:hypothetical protein